MLANQALMHCLGSRGNVAVMASEENEEPVVVQRDRRHGKYVVVFDPLDGSSNIDVNVSVGTIFSILRREPDPSRPRDPLVDVLQPGRRQLAAGYVVYGSSTMLVYTTGHGVYGFTLDPVRRRVRHQPRATSPCRRSGTIYSVNEANADSFPEPYRRYLAQLQVRESRPDVFVALHRLAGRRLPSHAAQGRHLPLSADPARIPAASCGCSTRPIPIAFLAEQAGGMATDGKQRHPRHAGRPACTSGRR